MAYKSIVQEAAAEVGHLPWDSLGIEKKIFNQMCKSKYWVVFEDKKSRGGGNSSLELNSQALSAVLFLRDNLLETTGQRIWGFTFTYHKDGKFNIEYDYTKPEGFDD